MWPQFQTKCSWEPCHENEINTIFEKKATKRITEHLFEAWKNKKKPGWMLNAVWSNVLFIWDGPKFKKYSERAKAARASKRCGSLHTGGSMSFAAHRRKLGEKMALLLKSSRRHIKRRRRTVRKKVGSRCLLRTHMKDFKKFWKIGVISNQLQRMVPKSNHCSHR